MKNDRNPSWENHLRLPLGRRPSPNHWMLKDSREQVLCNVATAWCLSPGRSTCTICRIAKPLLLKSKGRAGRQFYQYWTVCRSPKSGERVFCFFITFEICVNDVSFLEGGVVSLNHSSTDDKLFVFVTRLSFQIILYSYTNCMIKFIHLDIVSFLS